MKKNLKKKLRLHRETLALLESKAVSGGYVTSCTYPCDCPTGCSAEQPCMDEGAETAILD
jgi:dihydroorotase-like cyclic amidohydrolase